MCIALLSEIHANLFALEVALSDLEQRNIDRLVCLGDVASSGPQPHQTLARLYALNCPVVMGNTDQWLLESQPYEGEDDFYRVVSDINLWCASQLSTGDREFLRTFQKVVRIPLDEGVDMICYHGSPRSNDDLITSITPEDELSILLVGFKALVMAGGHTHVQMLRRHESSFLVNPGSVGLAFEQTASYERSAPWAEYAVIDWTMDRRINIAFHRVPYDLSDYFKVVAASGMPHDEWYIGKFLEQP